MADSFDGVVHPSLCCCSTRLRSYGCRPRGYMESSATYPVLYVLDANYTFPIAVEAARILAIGPKDNPLGDLKEQPVIIGIGYPVGLYWNAIPIRLKDFTPTSDPAFVSEVAKAI